MKTEIIPALIAKTQEELDESVNKVKDYVKYLQLDVMDGQFVPNHSLDFKFELPENSCICEAHLMVAEPKEWIDKLWDIAELFLIHFESTDNIEEITDYVKQKGKKAGIVINPGTAVEEIEKYLDKIDQVLVMTVNPGAYGSKFLPETLEKVKKLRELKPNLNIEVDGSINADTIKQAADAGANLFVSGSFIVKSEDPEKAVQTLRKLSEV